MLLSAVSVLVVAQSSSEIPEGLMSNPVLFLEWKSTCFGEFLSPSSGVFHCTHSKPVWHIALLCVQWKTPDDVQRNCPKHIEFHSKNKFEKLVQLVGFIIQKLSRCTVTWTSNIHTVCAIHVCILSCVAPRTGLCKPWHYHLLTFRDIGIIQRYL